MEKMCACCKQQKNSSEFYKASQYSDGLATRCKKCSDIASIDSKAKKPVHYRTKRKELRALYMHRYNQWKSTKKCVCCTEDDPDCLDLHHLDPNEKDVNVSDVARNWSWDKLVEEIRKCIIVCSNCHRKIHKGKINISGCSSAW